MKLTTKDVDDILSSEKKFAEYLSTLTVEQIDQYLDAVKGDKTMNAEAKKRVAELLRRVRLERQKAEQQIGWKVAPAVEGLATVMTLNEQIKALEEIQRAAA